MKIQNYNLYFYIDKILGFTWCTSLSARKHSFFYLPKLICCTAIPYREITGFLQGFPCVVILHLHALAVYRVWRVKFHWNTGKYIHSEQELAFYIYIHVYVFITGISLFFEKQQHGNLLKQGKPCKFDRGKNVNKAGK